MEWKKINSENDIDNLMKKFYNFHDSCITEFFCKTGMYIDERKNMGQDGISNIKITFKSQLCGTIEIYFEDVIKLNMHIYDKGNYYK